MYLIYDVTPISKPRSYDAPFTDTFAWPKMIHLSWMLLDENLKPLEDFDCIISGVGSSDAILKYSKLNAEEIERRGEPVEGVLETFAQTAEKAEYIIAFNNDVVEKVLAAEYMRKNMQPPFFIKERICLMQESTFFCKIPNPRGEGYKWPTLQELYALLFKQKYSPSGNARADVIATARAFIMLKKGGQLEDLFDE